MPENFEERENNEEKEITVEQFLNMLTSAEFMGVLQVCASETAKTDEETGFQICSNEGGLKVYDVKKGEQGGFAEPERIGNFAERVETTGRIANVLDFHFHPHSEEVAEPSGSDINLLVGFPILGIGCFTENGIKILLVRKKLNIHPNEIFEIADQIAQNEYLDLPQEEVIEKLDEAGLESNIISYRKRKEGYKLDKKSEKIILGLRKIKAIYD